MKMKKQNLGFTLIELMVTLAVLVILTMIAVPSFSKLYATQKLNSTTRQFVAVFQNAKSQAIILNKQISINLNSSTQNTSTVLNWIPETGNTLEQPTTLPVIIFQSNGTLKSQNDGNPFQSTDFVICNKVAEKAKTLTLNRMGSISMGADQTC